MVFTTPILSCPRQEAESPRILTPSHFQHGGVGRRADIRGVVRCMALIDGGKKSQKWSLHYQNEKQKTGRYYLKHHSFFLLLIIIIFSSFFSFLTQGGKPAGEKGRREGDTMQFLLAKNSHCGRAAHGKSGLAFSSRWCC